MVSYVMIYLCTMTSSVDLSCLVRLLAIFPWFSIVSALIAAFVAWRAASAVNAIPPNTVAERPAATASKESLARNEKVESA